jgi:uncharacterized metal-binding protein YceD (DUF177 family)
MPVPVNLRHLEDHNLHLKGELPVEELDLDLRDEIVRAVEPLQYSLELQKLEKGLLVQGHLLFRLQCECVRCLKPFEYALDLRDWTRLLPLEGEEKAPVINDCVDLTPYLREDILLEFPQHPLCEISCSGLPKTHSGKAKKSGGAAGAREQASAWGELDKLKF